MKTIIVPITEANRQGIDDLIDNVRTLFSDNILNITEAYVVETDNPGVEVIMTTLAAKSGNGNNYASAEKPKKKYNRKPKPAGTAAQPPAEQ